MVRRWRFNGSYHYTSSNYYYDYNSGYYYGAHSSRYIYFDGDYREVNSDGYYYYYDWDSGNYYYVDRDGNYYTYNGYSYTLAEPVKEEDYNPDGYRYDSSTGYYYDSGDNKYIYYDGDYLDVYYEDKYAYYYNYSGSNYYVDVSGNKYYEVYSDYSYKYIPVNSDGYAYDSSTGYYYDSNYGSKYIYVNGDYQYVNSYGYYYDYSSGYYIDKSGNRYIYSSYYYYSANSQGYAYDSSAGYYVDKYGYKYVYSGGEYLELNDAGYYLDESSGFYKDQYGNSYAYVNYEYKEVNDKGYYFDEDNNVYVDQLGNEYAYYKGDYHPVIREGGNTYILDSGGGDIVFNFDFSSHTTIVDSFNSTSVDVTLNVRGIELQNTQSMKLNNDFTKKDLWLCGFDVLGGTGEQVYTSIDDSIVNIDASDRTGDYVIAGNTQANMITAGNGKQSLWGGFGDADDTFDGSASGAKEYYFGKNEGHDVINNSSYEDSVVFWDASLEDLNLEETAKSMSTSKIVAHFNSGSSLEINAKDGETAASTFTVGFGGPTFRYNHTASEWVYIEKNA